MLQVSFMDFGIIPDIIEEGDETDLNCHEELNLDDIDEIAELLDTIPVDVHRNQALLDAMEWIVDEDEYTSCFFDEYTIVINEEENDEEANKEN